ncbi:S-layer homology domain-containing protein [Candidatus Peregrinibacteria bacterium]|nr:S-layer homology domain-containing protein [Candidatus Peregrinibacteria bacterium]
MNTVSTQASPLKASLKKALSLITMLTLALTLVVSQSGVANASAAITSFDVVETMFNPNTETATVNLTVNQTGRITLGVFDGVNPVKSLAFKKDVTAGSYSFTWDGRNNDGQKVEAGNYKVQLLFYSDEFALFKDDYVTVDYSGSGSTDPVVTNLYDSPDPFDPYDESTTIYFSLNQSSTVTLKIYDSIGANVKTILSNASYGKGSFKVLWNGRDTNGYIVEEGVYTYKLTAAGTYGTQNYNGNVTVDYDNGGVTYPVPVISSDYALPTPFDPNIENTYIYFDLNTQSDVTIQIYDGSAVVKTILNSTLLSGGNHAKKWDGRNSSGDIVDEKTYTYKITASNSAGSDVETGSIRVEYEDDDDDDDIVTPNITNAYASPVTFDPEEDEKTTIHYTINTCVYVTAKVYKKSNDAYVTTLLESDYMCSGSKTINWNGRNSSNSIAADGDYYIRITVNNSKGTDTEIENVTVDTDDDDDDILIPKITNVSVDPEVFDFYEDNTVLKFRLNTCADVTIKIVDEDNDLVRKILTSKELCEGTKTYTWNGKDDDGDYVTDDDYEFVITAENDEGEDTERIDVEVDRDADDDDDGSERCAEYKDVSINDPYCSAIRYVTEQDIFDGYIDGYFRPYQAISRAETTKVVLLGFDYPLLASDGTNAGFWDVDPYAWYMPYLRTAKYYGIIHGYIDGSFQPNKTVSRAELLKIFLEASNVYVPACSYQPYSDISVDAWYAKYICYSKTYGLMDPGYYNNFNPDTPMLRGDVAELFYRFHLAGLDDDAGYSGSTGTTTGTVRPDITNVYLSDYSVNQGDDVKINYTLNTRADVIVDVLDEDDDVVIALVDDVNQSSGKHTVTWNNTEDEDDDEVDEGEYTIRIKATNSKGYEKYEIKMEVDNGSSSSTDLKISNFNVTPYTFNPVNNNTLKISFRTNKTAYVTVSVYDEDDYLVKRLWDYRSTSAGEYQILWNGKDKNNNLVSDGDYYVRIVAENSNDEVEKEIDFVVDR